MKNYIFVNWDDLELAYFSEGGRLVSIRLISDLQDEDFGERDNPSELIILRGQDVIYRGRIQHTTRSWNASITIDAEREYEEADVIDWEEISSDPNLTQEFIEAHANSLNWYQLSCHYPMTEEFIERYAGRVNWSAICWHQKLSEDFVEKHADRIVWYALHKKQDFSEEFIEKHRRRLKNVL